MTKRNIVPWIISFVLLSVYFHGVAGIYCFQCNSLHDPDCMNIQPNDTSSHFYQPCGTPEEAFGREMFCRKIIQTIHDRDGIVRVIRKCGWIMHTKDCYRLSNKGHEEVICQCFHDACNSSPRFLKSSGLILAILGVIHLLK